MAFVTFVLALNLDESVSSDRRREALLELKSPAAVDVAFVQHIQGGGGEKGGSGDGGTEGGGEERLETIRARATSSSCSAPAVYISC